MQHQLIMFAGSSPGAGKSTLSYFLFRQLSAHAIPVAWLHEEAFLHLPSFAPFLHDLTASYPKLDLLLQAAAVLPMSYADQVIITDSFLPGYHLFFGNHLTAAIKQYNLQLYNSFHTLDPLIIYLKTDIATAYARAVQQRGVVWQERMIRRMNMWQLPRYDQKPFRSLHDVIAFEQHIDELSLFLIEQWPGRSLVLDATATPLAHLQSIMLTALELNELDTHHFVLHETLFGYMGTYVGRDEEASPPQLVITLRDVSLLVNTYWPNGTRLVAETDTRFRLEATNRWIEFGGHQASSVDELVYWTGATLHRYVKVKD